MTHGRDEVRYLVGYRPSAGGEQSLSLAVSMAQAFGASLDLVGVITHRRGERAAQDSGEARRARRRLQQVADAVPRDVPARVHVRFAGDIAQGLLAASAELDSRIIVIGPGRGRRLGGALRRHSVGVVASALLASRRCEVALAPVNYRATGPIESVDCAVGLRPGGLDVLEAAVRTCVRTGLPLRVITLVDADGEIDDAGVDEARAHVAQLLRGSVQRHGRPVRTDMVFARGGDIAAVVEAIAWVDAAVLIVGARRIDDARKIGRTVARILAHLPIPLIVVPQRG